MNIFVLSEDPKECAEMHLSKHCIKMILEHCQLLSTAHHVLDDTPKPSLIYKSTHVNHPCAIWVRESILNYIWLVDLTKQLCKEYTYRYGRVHKSEDIGLVDWLEHNPPENIDYCEMTKFKLAMPDECKVSDPVESYRNYYRMHKQHIADWTGKVADRKVPDWFIGV